MHSSGRDRSHRDGCGSTPRPKLIRAVTLVTEYECNRAFLISIKSFNIYATLLAKTWTTL
jgi:hypothetical protein